MSTDGGSGSASDRSPSENVAVSGEPAGVPTCYRHPKREAHIRCVRCNRPICPDCMITASVGFQCPDCVRAGNSTQRATRTAFGGRARQYGGASVTYTLIALNVAAMLVELAWPQAIDRFSIVPGGRAPLGGGHFAFVTGVATGQYYRLLTGMFLHLSPTGGGLGITHILFNMWALAVVGPPIERWLGRLRFLVLYLLGGLFASAFVYLLAPVHSETLGASGAIFGLFAAMFVLARRLRYDARPIAGVIGVNIVITFMLSGISWQGHVGGLLAGGALSAAWAYAPRKHRTLLQICAGAALLIAIVVIVIVRTHALTHASLSELSSG